MKHLFLLAALSLPCQAQVMGRLMHYGDGQLQIGSTQISGEGNAYQQVIRGGLGSRWQIWTDTGNHMSRAVSLGKDVEVERALNQLSSFAAKVGSQDYTGARALVAPAAQSSPEQFASFWESHWIPPEHDQWTLKQCDAQSVQVDVQMQNSNAGNRTNKFYRPQKFKSTLTLQKVNGSWLVGAWTDKK